MAQSLVSLSMLSDEFRSVLDPHPRKFLLKCCCSFGIVMLALVLCLTLPSKSPTIQGTFRYPASQESSYLRAPEDSKLIWMLPNNTQFVTPGQLVAITATPDIRYDTLFSPRHGLISSSVLVGIGQSARKGDILFKISDSKFDLGSGELLVPTVNHKEITDGAEVVCTYYDNVSMKNVSILGKVYGPPIADSLSNYTTFKYTVDSISNGPETSYAMNEASGNAIVKLKSRSLLQHLLSNLF